MQFYRSNVNLLGWIALKERKQSCLPSFASLLSTSEAVTDCLPSPRVLCN